MSTHWGYVCESHDPPLISERWLNHGEEVLIDLFHQMRSGTWPIVPETDLAWGGTPLPLAHQSGRVAVPTLPRAGGGTPPYSGPAEWLQEHPNCKVALRNEYGDRREIGDTITGEVAPAALEQ